MPGVHYIDLGETTSTNDEAKKYALNGYGHGTVVTATSQTQGRGRRGRKWHDEPGKSLVMSAIVTQAVAQENIHHWNFVSGLACARCLEREYGLRIAIKWPNDLVLNDRKLGGLLAEAVPLETGYACVCGIGMNINQDAFPEEISGLATSLAMHTGETLIVKDVIRAIGGEFFETSLEYAQRGFKEILDNWRNYMWGVGKNVQVELAGEKTVGEIVDVDHNGALVIINGTEKQIICAADAIRTLRK